MKTRSATMAMAAAGLAAAAVCQGQTQQWDRRFGGSGSEWSSDVQQTKDGGYVQCGATDSGAEGDKSQASRGGIDYWVVKMDATGAKQWDRRFGGSGNEWCYSVQQTKDGGYMLGGDTFSGAEGDKSQSTRGSADYWIVKLDANGTKQWDRRFGSPGVDSFVKMMQTADGGYILGGHTTSGAGGDKTDDSRGGNDYWIVKTDANGTKQWDKRFGGANADELNGSWQTTDGGYILGGHSNSGLDGDKSQGSRGVYDYWLVKVGVLPPDAYENDPTQGSAKPISNGPTQQRSIHEPGDVDWAKMVIGSAGAQNVRVETFGTSGDTEMWIYRGVGGPQVGHNDDGGGTSVYFSRLSFGSLAGGTYFIKVIRFGNNLAIPAYSLKARWTPLYAPDAYEADNGRTSAKRIQAGQTQSRTIHRQGNVDWAKFTLGGNGARGVLIQTSGTGGDTEMRLYNSAGTRLAFDDDSGPGRYSRIQRGPFPAGTYYIQVREKGNDGTLPAYKLYANWVLR